MATGKRGYLIVLIHTDSSILCSFIPNRGAVDLTTTFNLLSEGGGKTPASPASPGSAKRKIHRGPECDAQKG